MLTWPGFESLTIESGDRASTKELSSFSSNEHIKMLLYKFSVCATDRETEP